MSLSDRLARRREAGKVTVSNRGCNTCRWLASRTEAEREGIRAWIADGLSLSPLWEDCAAEGLPVGLSSFRTHVRECNAG